jgi:hypothetical protein
LIARVVIQDFSDCSLEISKFDSTLEILIIKIIQWHNMVLLHIKQERMNTKDTYSIHTIHIQYIQYMNLKEKEKKNKNMKRF